MDKHNLTHRHTKTLSTDLHSQRRAGTHWGGSAQNWLLMCVMWIQWSSCRLSDPTARWGAEYAYTLKKPSSFIQARSFPKVRWTAQFSPLLCCHHWLKQAISHQDWRLDSAQPECDPAKRHIHISHINKAIITFIKSLYMCNIRDTFQTNVH